jgi:maleate isomerase
MSGITRIGMLTPSSNTCLEPMTQEMIVGLPDVTLHFARVPVVSIGLTARESAQFEIDTMVDAARLLADAGVDVIAWNGTAGSWLGLEHDRRLVQAVTDGTAVPATTSTLAFFAAFQALGVKTYGLAVPYTGDVTQRIIATYEHEGLNCLGEAHLDLRQNVDIGRVEESEVAELLGRVALPEADAVLAVCTNFAGARVAADVEQRHGLPVLDSVAVTLWHCLQLAGRDTEPLTPWGRIFGVPVGTG